MYEGMLHKNYDAGFQLQKSLVVGLKGFDARTNRLAVNGQS
jgi:hypothetical protein